MSAKMSKINQAGAGNALNRIIAECVMSWTYWDSAKGDWDGPDNATFFTDWDTDSLAVYVASEEPTFYFAPSIRIADAWMIVEKLRTDSWRWVISSREAYTESWRVAIEKPSHWEAKQSRKNTTTGSSLPLAICRVALKAIESTALDAEEERQDNE